MSLVLRQVRFTNKAFWRNPASAFFTFAFPLMFLVIFTSLLGDGELTIRGYDVHLVTYYVVAEAAFGVISACYTNIAISVSFQRDQGILKRTRGTPLPGRAYMSARVVHAMVIAFVLVAITVAFGVIFYSASVPTGVPLLQFVLTLLVGGLSFAALALALTAAIPNADASPPIVNATVLPLLFLSGIFIPIGDDAPAWIRAVSNIFPIRHFFEAMVDGFLGNLTIQSPGWRRFLAWTLAIPQLYGKLNHDHHVLWFAALLAVSPCADVLAVDAIPAARRRADGGGVRPPGPSRAYALPIRIIWVLLGLIYLFPGFWKVWSTGFTWISSENLRQHMFLKWHEFDDWTPMLRIDEMPLLLLLGALGTVVFELSFLALVLSSRLRAGCAESSIVNGLLDLIDSARKAR